MSPTKKPTRASTNGKARPSDEQIAKASATALAMLRRKYSRVEADHEDLVSDARAYALGHPDLESYVARVTKKAALLAIDRIRQQERLRRPVEVEVERPATLDALRRAVRAECWARFENVAGLRPADTPPVWSSDPWAALLNNALTPQYVQTLREQAKVARRMLRVLDDAPEWPATSRRRGLRACVDVESLMRLADETTTYYRALADRVDRLRDTDIVAYGKTDTEAAVLSILEGVWPKKARLGMTAGEVIRLAADAIRKARTAPEK